MSVNQTIEVMINGESRRIESGASLSWLIEELQLPPQRIAIEHNLEIITKARWAETILHEGDRLEIVHFVGGG